jgi:hypothetical protein
MALAPQKYRQINHCSSEKFPHVFVRRELRRNGSAISQVFAVERAGRRTTMDRRDRQLLDKQMKRFQPSPWRDGLMIPALVGVFLSGLTAGGLLFSFGSQTPAQTVTNDGNTALAFFLNGARTATR